MRHYKNNIPGSRKKSDKRILDHLVKNERELVKILREKLEEEGVFPPHPLFKQVKGVVKPFSSKFYPEWERWYKELYPDSTLGPPPAQPDIDILIVDTQLQLLAIEVKHMIPVVRTFFKPSYYEGIGQALALLELGFSYVSLWQCFDNAPAPPIVRYRKLVQELISELKLPINYKALWVIGVKEEGGGQKVKFLDVTHVEDFQKASEADFRNLPYGGSINPLREKQEVKRKENIVRNLLNIPYIK